MKFRQRVAWLMVLGYLGATLAFFNYLFEINEHYNKFALDHVNKFHTTSTGGESQKSVLSTIWGHVTDLPLPVWLLIFLLPYLQLFMMILACTRVEPKQSYAYRWPGLVLLKLEQAFSTRNKAVVSSVVARVNLNGPSVLHT